MKSCMLLTIVLIVAIAESVELHAQKKIDQLDSLAYNAVSVNVANAIFIGGVAVMYDRNIRDLPKSRVMAKTGFARGFSFGEYMNVFSFGFGHLLGKRSHHIEYDLGIHVVNTYEPQDARGVHAVPLLNLGYRFQKPGGGLIGRLGVGSVGVYAGAGVSF